MKPFRLHWNCTPSFIFSRASSSLELKKLIKPDPRIYKLLFERYSINPETAIFIDDNAKNVAGAKAVGLDAVHFQSPKQLEQYLAEIGIL